MVHGAGFRVQGAGFRVQGAGFRVQGSGFAWRGGLVLLLVVLDAPRVTCDWNARGCLHRERERERERRETTGYEPFEPHREREVSENRL